MSATRLVPGLLVGALVGCVGQVGETGSPAAEEASPSTPGATPTPGAAPGPGAAAASPPAPEGSSSAAATPTLPPAGCALPVAGLVKLTPLQYERTIAALIPRAPLVAGALAATLPPSTSGFSNEALRLEMSEPHVGALVATGEDLARVAVGNVTAAAACLSGKVDVAACVRTFVRDFGGRAFRRTLAPEEEERYFRFFSAEAATTDARAALGQLIHAFLLSPHFLFRTELGAGAGAGARVTLTPWERASALSYLLADGPPDAELSAAGRSGALADPAEVRRQAERLLARPETAPGLQRFFAEHLVYPAAAALDRDAKRFPTFAAARSLLPRETEAFVQQVLWREDGRLATLLGARFSMLNDTLAGHYGVAGVTGRDLRRVELAEARRAGLLTHGSWLALHARAEEPDIVSRGRFVRERLLCQEVPPPPPDANAVPPPPDRTLTHRERIERHSRDPVCAGCHQLLDPIGIAFEHYDADGRLRTTEGGKPIDASGRIVSPAGTTIAFRDAFELVDGLARDAAVAGCFVRRVYQFAHARPADAADACATEGLARRFAAEAGDVRRLVADLASDESFLARRRP